ncbi:MAG TPA: efflux RND transporter permease subunit [Phycisphaerales bacterium]|nr:efflux RND transporter permease subunit [Phycisphaerales bacterium]
MSLASFGVRRPVVANLVMLAIVAAGVIFGFNLRREFFPEIRPNLVLVTAPYPSASPDEVEQALAKKIEDAIDTLDDVEEINTTVSQGGATLSIEFAEGVDVDQKVADVKREIDALQDLPEESDRIVVQKLEPNLPTINVSLFGDTDERTMKRAIRQIKDDLESIPGMGDISESGVRGDEIRIEVRPEALIKYRLSMPAIADRIRAEMQELPGGTVQSNTVNISVRTLGTEETSEQIRRLVIRADGQGEIVRLGDIADITEGFVDVDVRSRLNGKPAFSLTVFKVGDGDAVEIAEMVKAYAAGINGQELEMTLGERFKTFMAKGRQDQLHRKAVKQAEEAGMPAPAEPRLEPVSGRIRAYELGRARAAAGGVPPGAQVAVTTDLAKFIVGRLNLLTRNALWGGILVFGTLVLLLNWRVSFWVALGLVISLLGTLAVMSFVGITLNLLTMFGLIVVIGLLVDDAIVVAENIMARHEQGESALQAAIGGTNQVGWPVVATVLTTVCAFLPLALIQGEIGDFLEVLPIVVVCALGVSLIESLLILPSHMGHSLLKVDRRRAKGQTGRLARIESGFDNARDAFFNKMLIPAYLRLLRLAIRFRYVTTAIAIGLVLISAGLVRGGLVEFIFFETGDSETISGELRMPIGTPTDVTDQYLSRIESVCLAQPEVVNCWAIAGAYSSLDGGGGGQQGHLGQVILEIMPVEEREAHNPKLRPSPEIIEDVMAELGEMPGIKSFRMEGVAGGPSGPAITLTVVGHSEELITRIVDEVKRTIAMYPGVTNIVDDSDRGQRELRFHLRDGASELGFTTAMVAQQIRGAVFGLEPYTFAGDNEDVSVRLMMPERVRRSLAAIENLELISPAGDAVPLPEVVRVEEVEGYATVRRLDGKRAVTVTADVDRQSGANPEIITAALHPVIAGIASANPGIDILERGRQKEVAESFSTLPIGMLVAAGLIYVILAWLFSSYIQPLVVMSAIPFAMVGMVWGHLIMHTSMTFLSLIGFVALAGVVVNDSLIFVEFFNEKRSAGLGLADAALAAGRARLRAILLTTITTVLGLMPLMLENSFQAKFLIPMAITISFGLMSATLITLVVLPCLLLIFDDVHMALLALWRGRVVPREEQVGLVGHDTAATLDDPSL